MFRTTKLALAAIVSFSAVAVPIGAQSFSEGYKFLEAVRKRDGSAVAAALSSSSGRIVNTKDGSTGDTALHVVARERDLQWLRYMLAKGARPDLANKNGETALIFATQLGWVEGATALLAAGAKADTANSRGETPLILAVLKRNVPMIRLLLANGADPKRTDRIAGYSAMDYAKRDDRGGVIVRLLETTAEPAKPVAGPPR